MIILFNPEESIASVREEWERHPFLFWLDLWLRFFKNQNNL